MRFIVCVRELFLDDVNVNEPIPVPIKTQEQIRQPLVTKINLMELRHAHNESLAKSIFIFQMKIWNIVTTLRLDT